MAFKIIILNGEHHGERLDVASTPMPLANGAAELVLRGEELFVKGLAEGNPIRVNEAVIQESRLKHADVIQIGATRYFVHEYAGQRNWTALDGIRQKRAWLTLGLPLLLVAGLILGFHRCHRPAPAPAAKPLPAASTVTTNPAQPQYDDSVVTNIPRIQINPSVTLTTKPPEIADAVAVMVGGDTNQANEALDNARRELEQGTRFLQEKSEASGIAPALTNQEAAVGDLTQAEGIIKEAAPAAPAETNLPALPAEVPSAPTIPQ